MACGDIFIIILLTFQITLPSPQDFLRQPNADRLPGLADNGSGGRRMESDGFDYLGPKTVRLEIAMLQPVLLKL